MFPFSTYSLDEPRKKKSYSKETILLPLPIPILCPQDKNLENVSKLLSGRYSAILIDNRVYVKDEQQSKILFNCGYFGKGEYSRGEPNLNETCLSKLNKNENENEDLSLNIKNITHLNDKKYEHRSEWSRLISKQNENDFNQMFLNEFVHKKLNKLNLENNLKYCMIKYDDKLSDIEFLNQHDKLSKSDDNNLGKLYKTSNDLFSIKIKKYPNLNLIENLILSYEETFFLCYGLDCLSVEYECDNKTTILTIDQLWNKFIKFDSNFPFKYAVYHKLRSKGWVVKYGIKYGCDFLVYYEGPDRYHASYSIKIKLYDELKSNRDNNEEDFTQFSSLLRINETASKKLIYFYIIYKSDEIDLNNVKCLNDMKLIHMFVNRWVPQENRD